jgi:hypothetical protein
VNSIARAGLSLNDQDAAGAETPRGLLRLVCTPVQVRSEPGESRSILWGAGGFGE